MSCSRICRAESAAYSSFIFLISFFSFQFPHAAHAGTYYRETDIGSDAFYTPLNGFSHYVFDSLQLSENFDQEDFDERLDTVLDFLSHPGEAIDNEGGSSRFINREIFPIDSDYSSDWPTMLPNYFLHLLGGGMVYRRDLEYFREHDYEYPQLAAVSLAMTAELIQEAFERKTTSDSDAVADFYIFRPLGIWLFASDERAAYIKEKLDPAIWPHLLYYDPENEQFSNAGLNYALRLQPISDSGARPFLYLGMNALLGLAHNRGEDDHLSWGLGYAVESIDSNGETLEYELRPSCGLFYDRGDSLLWSAIINGTENLKLRANIYPLRPTAIQLGFAFGITDEDEPFLGVTLNMPFGVGKHF
jgi:hypothetical protein